MARVRFIGPETVTVPELGDRVVEPDEVVEIPDDRFEGYVCQPQTWESVEEPKEEPTSAPLLPMRKSAVKPQKDEV
ncbi:hypothetical protein OG302_22300 [Streptomyces sp. NBC_01283]|uniref:hypothetical protein n=1 Tax=Streptomyces sp. NBC_01283 TaxID=2903812 RepID=UPI00352DFC31|nr:hypothetical protein OG302_22300 [Streptomyces sp. NBC_01283]